MKTLLLSLFGFFIGVLGYFIADTFISPDWHFPFGLIVGGVTIFIVLAFT